MQIEIISTGDEVLTGFITDTNAAWLSQELLNLGLQVHRRETIGDKLEDIENLISERAQYADVILVNGGLGPTSDDNTTLAAAKAAGVELELHQDWLKRIEEWCKARGRRMAPTNKKQAFLPKGAVMLDNPAGTACGFRLKIKHAMCFFTPGVPHEFKRMFNAEIKPYLQQHVSGMVTNVKRLFLFGISESRLGELVERETFDPGIVIGYRAAYPLLELKLIEHDASDTAKADALAKIMKIVSPYLICSDEFNLPQRLDLKLQHAPIALLDSVTSGLLASELSQALQIKAALITDHDPGQAGLEFIHKIQADYYFALFYDADNRLNLYLAAADGKVIAHDTYRLSFTLSNKKKAACSLIAQAWMLAVLEQRLPLQPDDAEYFRLKDN